jgi:transcriptional regulator with GAF, ATPase, and Fis domain
MKDSADCDRETSVTGYMAASSLEAPHAERPFEQIVGNSPALESVLDQVEQVAPTNSTVLIEGVRK